MTLAYRKGDLIRLTAPTMSGWQGVGVVLKPVHQDDDPDTVVAFRKQGEDDDATPSIALLSEVEPLEPSDEELADVYWKAWHEYHDRTNSVLHSVGLRAVLARFGNPAPAPPAGGEVAELAEWLQNESHHQDLIGETLLRHAAELLQRQAPVPVPVSERLPGPEDCDAEGECWWWHPSHPESGYSEGWMLRPRSWGVGHYDFDDRPTHTHWLPAHALPVPEVDE